MLTEITAPGRSACHFGAMRLAMLPVGSDRDQGNEKERGDAGATKDRGTGGSSCRHS